MYTLKIIENYYKLTNYSRGCYLLSYNSLSIYIFFKEILNYIFKINNIVFNKEVTYSIILIKLSITTSLITN